MGHRFKIVLHNVDLNMRRPLVRLGTLFFLLIVSTSVSWATCPASIAKLAGTYTGAGTMYDYNTSLALEDMATVTASLSISSTGSVTMTMYAKSGLTQDVSTISLSGIIRSFNTVTCIAEYYISSSTTSTTKVAISNNGLILSFSDYTGTSGKTRVFSFRLEKI